MKFNEKGWPFFQGKFLSLVNDLNSRSIQEFERSRRQSGTHDLGNGIGGFANGTELCYGSHKLCWETGQPKGNLCDHTQSSF